MRDIALPPSSGPSSLQHLAAATLGLGTLYERRGEAFIRIPVHRRQHEPTLEWHARHEAGRLVHLAFTFETLEEWAALAAASPKETVGLYRDLLGRPEVAEGDLLWRRDVFARGEDGHVLAFAAGAYNPFNAWNTLRGAVHLTRPASHPAGEERWGERAGIALPEGGLLFLGDADVTADVLHPRRRDDRTGRVTRLEVETPAGAFYDLEDLSLPGGEPLTPLGLAHRLVPTMSAGAERSTESRVPPVLPGSLVAGAMLRRMARPRMAGQMGRA